MGKAGERRQRKLARYFSELAERDVEKFLREWEKRVGSWLEEIERRGTRQRVGAEPGRSERYIFDVLERAETLLGMCSPAVNVLVGQPTRLILVRECSRAVEGVYAARPDRSHGGDCGRAGRCSDCGCRP